MTPADADLWAPLRPLIEDIQTALNRGDRQIAQGMVLGAAAVFQTMGDEPRRTALLGWAKRWGL